MSRPVLVLDYSLDGKSGANISRWFPSGHHIVRVEPASTFPHIETSGITAVVHSGSAQSILDDPPFISGAMDFIRGMVTEGVPQMGICYGHQLLARTLCGDTAVSRCPSVELGWLPVEFLPSWPAPDLRGSYRVWQSHYDRVDLLPPGSEVTATNVHTRIQAFWNRELRLFGTQFHPEFDRKTGNSCFMEDPAIFEKNGIDLHLTVSEGPGFQTGPVVFGHFLKAFEQEL